MHIYLHISATYRRWCGSQLSSRGLSEALADPFGASYHNPNPSNILNYPGGREPEEEIATPSRCSELTKVVDELNVASCSVIRSSLQFSFIMSIHRGLLSNRVISAKLRSLKLSPLTDHTPVPPPSVAFAVIHPLPMPRSSITEHSLVASLLQCETKPL